MAALAFAACSAAPGLARAQEAVDDPWEGFNRDMYAVHDSVDRAVLEPVARGYRSVTPGPVRTGVRNFLRNLRSPVTFVNDLLQGEIERAGVTFVRFGVNTTVGMAGLLDPATSMGMERHDEDFGQTLAVWGVEPGPYIFVPVLGPTTLRDGAGGPAAQRRQTFNRLMAQFADMPRIANFVLGRYGAQLRSDAALRADWTRTFQEYAIAVYEDRLERFSGSSIRVTGSVERVPGRDVIVSSELQPRTGGRPTQVQWRLLRSGDVWKVVDISLVLDGNEIWLAQQQQRDFLAALDRNNGDIRALMSNLRELTASMRERIMARS